MYYIQETMGSDYETYDENVVRFSESKEELDVICKKLQDNYTTDYNNWKDAHNYYKKLKEIVAVELKHNVDGVTYSNQLEDYYINKFQRNNPVPKEIRKFLYFKNDNQTVRDAHYEINRYLYEVKEVIVAKYI